MPHVDRPHTPRAAAPSSTHPRRSLPRLTLLAALACTLGLPARGEEYVWTSIDPAVSTDPRYTSVRILPLEGPTNYLGFDVDSRKRYWTMWNRVVIGDASLPARTNVGLVGYDQIVEEVRVNLSIGSLDLTRVNLRLDRVHLVLNAPDSTVSLRDASLLLDGTAGALSHVAGGSLSILALSGDNSIERGTRIDIGSPVHVKVSPGASLTWRDFNNSAALDPASNLRFRGKGTTIDVDGGRFVLDRAVLTVDEGVVRLTNGAEFVTSGSEWSGGSFKDLHFINSRLTMGHITEVTATDLLLFSNSTARLDGNAHLNARYADFAGTSLISGPVQDASSYINSFLDVREGVLFDSATLRLAGLGNAKFGNLTAVEKSRLQLDKTTMYAQVVELRGASVEVGDGSALILTASAADLPLVTGRLLSVTPGSSLTITPGGLVSVGEGTRLAVDDKVLGITNDSRIQVFGYLEGNGTVRGSGTVLVKPGGAVMPQIGKSHGALQIDNSLFLEAGARLVWRVDPAGALPTRPLVTYGPRSVVFQGAPVVEVRGTGALSADALAGKSVTVVAAQAPGVAGTLDARGLMPTVKAVDMPALLSYTVGDTGTNGKPDVTLFMDKLPVSMIQKNPALNTKNRQGAATLLVGAAPSNPTITQALNTVTNEQLAGTVAGQPTGWLDQIHAEPYSSFTTVNLEMIANNRNLVFMRALETDPRGRRFWVDTTESRGEIEGQAGLGSFGYGLTTLTLGQDFGVWGGGAWGGYLSAGRSRMDEHDIANQSLRGTTTSAGVYAQWRHKGWEGRVLVGAAQGQQESTRELVLGGAREGLRASYASRSLQAGVRLSTDWINAGGVELRPEIGGSVTTLHKDGFTESGSATYALKVAPARVGTRIVHAGLNASLPRIWATVPLRPVGFLRLEHDFSGSREHVVQAALASQPERVQSFIGQGRGPTTATAALGLVSDAPGAWQVAGGLAFSQHTHGTEWSAGVKLRVLW